MLAAGRIIPLFIPLNLQLKNRRFCCRICFAQWTKHTLMPLETAEVVLPCKSMVFAEQKPCFHVGSREGSYEEPRPSYADMGISALSARSLAQAQIQLHPGACRRKRPLSRAREPHDELGSSAGRAQLSRADVFRRERAHLPLGPLYPRDSVARRSHRAAQGHNGFRYRQSDHAPAERRRQRVPLRRGGPLLGRAFIRHTSLHRQARPL